MSVCKWRSSKWPPIFDYGRIPSRAGSEAKSFLHADDQGKKPVIVNCFFMPL
jgi:hypothetical protein